MNFDAFHIMAKPIGPVCNLNCEYCYYLEKEKLYPADENWKMPENVLEKYVKEYIASQKVSEVVFSWQGGEPTLLGIDFFRKAIKFQKQYSNGKKIINTFQTNGVLLNDAWCDFLANNNFLVGLSIDGPREIHDKYRKMKGEQPTFKKVYGSLKLLKKHGVEFNTLTCVQRDNSYKAKEVYGFLKSEGSRFLQFIPIVERRAEPPAANGLFLVLPNYKGKAVVTDWSVEPLQYGKFLSEVFDEWVRNDVGEIYVNIFDLMLEAWYGMQPSLCVFRETCGNAMVIEHNGDIYSCDHYVYPEYKLGNIMESDISMIVNSKKQIEFGEAKKSTLPRYCLECEYKFACNGECPKHRFVKTPDGEEGLNYLCEGYKYFFSHIDVYMKFMANELRHQRPPANVMAWAKEKDLGFPSLNPGRNDPCPCGSGKKYKNCCGLNVKKNKDTH